MYLNIFEYDINDEKEKIKNVIFSEFYTLKDIHKNCETLYLNLEGNRFNSSIKHDNFISLNNLKSLKHISFQYIELSSPFIIKLNNLETLIIRYCNNLYLYNENSTKKLKYLYINNLNNSNESNINNNNYILPSLEELYIYDSKININFSSLVKRKKLGFNDISILEKCNNYSPIF